MYINLYLCMYVHMYVCMCAYVYTYIQGLSIGLREPVRLSVLGKFFGTAHLAEITGMTKMYHMFGLAAGPLIITVCRDWDGQDYARTLHFFALCSVLVSGGILFFDKPQRTPGL